MRQLGLKGDISYADKITPSIAIGATTKLHRNYHGPGPRTARVGLLKPEALTNHVKKVKKQMIHPAAGGHSMQNTSVSRAFCMIRGWRV
jgi:hypothetical protein